MGVDISVRLVKLNRNNGIYEEVTLYRKNEKDKIEPVDLFTGRFYELFSILDGTADDYFPSRKINLTTLSKPLKEEVQEKQNIPGYYDFFEANLADIKNYLTKHPIIRNYNYEEGDPKEWTDNPVKELVDKICSFLYFYDPYDDWLDSDIKLIYWFDC